MNRLQLNSLRRWLLLSKLSSGKYTYNKTLGELRLKYYIKMAVESIINNSLYRLHVIGRMPSVRHAFLFVPLVQFQNATSTERAGSTIVLPQNVDLFTGREIIPRD